MMSIFSVLVNSMMKLVKCSVLTSMNSMLAPTLLRQGGVLAGEFELFDDVGHLFAGYQVVFSALVFLVMVAEDEEGGAFEEYCLTA